MITHEHEARDGRRTFKFVGVLLGEASSRSDSRPRWTEVRVYRTEAEHYVVEIVGRSTIPGETDRCRAFVCDDARGAVESLHVLDRDRVRYIPRINREAAVIAASNDDVFSQAFYVEEVA